MPPNPIVDFDPFSSQRLVDALELYWPVLVTFLLVVGATGWHRWRAHRKPLGRFGSWISRPTPGPCRS